MFKLSIGKTTKTALLATAGVASVGILATAAFAAVPHYRITAGTKSSGTETYTAHTTGTPGIHFSDTKSHQDLTCASGTATGKMNLGPNVSGTKAGTITGTTWTNCNGPGGLILKPKQVGTWYINGDARPLNGVTKVHVSNVVANVSSAAGCKFTVSGSTDGTYNNTTHKLTFTAPRSTAHRLTLSNVTVDACFTLLHDGDHATFKASYLIKTLAGAIKIR